MLWLFTLSVFMTLLPVDFFIMKNMTSSAKNDNFLLELKF